jgi:hypothetical protein
MYFTSALFFGKWAKDFSAGMENVAGVDFSFRRETARARRVLRRAHFFKRDRAQSRASRYFFAADALALSCILLVR